MYTFRAHRVVGLAGPRARFLPPVTAVKKPAFFVGTSSSSSSNSNEDEVLIAIRGTASIDDVVTDVTLATESVEYRLGLGLGTVSEDEIEEKYGLEDQNEQDNSRISLFEEAEKVQNGISFNDDTNNVNCQMLIDEHANQDF